MRIRLRYIVLALVLATLAISAGRFLYKLDRSWRAEGPLQDRRVVYIPRGTGGAKIAAILEKKGVIENALTFRLLARINRVGGTLKAGEYKFPARSSIADVIARMQAGDVVQRRVTVPEGLTSAEIAELINNTGRLEGHVEPPEEGSLLPDTYHFVRDDSREELIARMQRAMETSLAEAWSKRDADIPLKTPEEAVVLASIVEKETSVAAERARIAGVFYNRIAKGMPLQSDPTVIYAITEGKERLGRPLLRSDLAAESPYNTYRNTGLPPGPIANPGLDALKAVLNPEKHGFFYFVADGTGGHAFSESLKEHNKKVAEWRAFLRKQKDAK